MYQDETLLCADCGQNFLFNGGEQTFFAEKGFKNKPTRCKDCRQARKVNRTPSPDIRLAPSSLHSSGSRVDREMFPASCTVCSNMTQVPFKPIPGKPLYCRNCFPTHRLAASQ